MLTLLPREDHNLDWIEIAVLSSCFCPISLQVLPHIGNRLFSGDRVAGVVRHIRIGDEDVSI